jgi:hypothetical protein
VDCGFLPQVLYLVKAAQMARARTVLQAGGTGEVVGRIAILPINLTVILTTHTVRTKATTIAVITFVGIWTYRM